MIRMTGTMKIRKTATGYVIKASDQQVFDLFGTDTIPTSFSEAADPSVVLATIRRLNPDCKVSMAVQA